MKGFTECKKIFDESLRKIAMLGYGVVLISHSKTLNKKDEKTGEEYPYITCSLPDMAKLIANRFVDMICYLHTDDEGNRWLYTRGNKNLEAGSRFQYLEPKVALDYNVLVEELAKAIDKQAESNGRVAQDTQELSVFYKEDEKSFEDVMEEAKALFLQINTPENTIKIKDAIVKVFGKEMRISEATAAQKELVEDVIEEWKHI